MLHRNLNRSRPTTNGAALVPFMMLLLTMVMMVLGIASEQVTAQHQLLALEHKRFARQLATESLFEQVALARQQVNVSAAGGLLGVGTGALGEASLLPEGEVAERPLEAYSWHIECPHVKDSDSQCWAIRVQQQGTGFARERVLVLPADSCGANYWYAPAASIASAWQPPIQPEPDPPIKPEDPPSRLPRR